MGERKFVQTVQMAATPIYGKNHKKPNGLETWYVASGVQVLLSLFK